MESAQIIRNAVAGVNALRQASSAHPALGLAVAQVKRLQSLRFAGTYADLLGGAQYQGAARFFLEELYSDQDYADRDAQFSRIAGALQRLLPQHAVATAVSLAELHQLTEQLDHDMAHAWLNLNASTTDATTPQSYVAAWRRVARRNDRQAQLMRVLGIGRELDRLTRTPGLRLMLKMMRGPASAAGLASLQHFLEAGFDTFAAMTRQPGGTKGFLALIEHRETTWITSLFEQDATTCAAQLARTLEPAGE